MAITCPIECVKDNVSFIKENEAFLLTVVATISGIIGLLLSTCMKSRCTNIRTPCLSCERTPLDPDDTLGVISPEPIQVREVRIEK